MKETEITIRIKESCEVSTDVNQASGVQGNENAAAAGYTIYSDDDPDVPEAEAERYAVASDLADVCDYLEESEVIKIRLIVQKAQARKEREEKG